MEKTLLVVDDDRDFCATLADMLTDLGYRVDASFNAQHAIELIKKCPYRVALLDYKLPCMTGVELFERLREVDPHLAAVLITAFAGTDAEEKAMACGMRCILHKPVDMTRLLPLIAEAVG